MVREWSIERDDRLLRELYPDVAKRVMPYIEEECDRMEYNGSRMYDEFPDKYMLQRMNSRIYEKARKELEEDRSLNREAAFSKGEKEIYEDDDIFATDIKFDGRNRQGNYLRELIEVLVCHEMFSRRCRHNQCKRCRR